MILGGSVPSGWSTVPLRRVVRKVVRPVNADSGVVTAYRDGEVTLRSLRRADGYTLSDTESGYQGVLPGDLVFHALDGFAGAVGIANAVGKCSPVYHVCTATSGDHLPYIAYVLRVMGWSGFLEAQASSVRQRSVDFRAWESFARLPIPRPPAEDQKVIARYLDNVVARTDQLMDSMRLQLELLLARRYAVVDDELRCADNDLVPIKYLASIVDTEHKTAPRISGGDFWIAGTSAVRHGDLLQRALYETDLETYVQWTRRLRPAAGDILFSREAPVGEVGILKKDHPPLAIGQRMVLIRANHRVLRPEYLLWTLLSERTRTFVDLATQGSLHPHLNMRDIGSLLVQRLPLAQQEQIVMRIERLARDIDRVIVARRTMLDLLMTRKQSVIASAVTGRLDETPGG